MCHTMNKTFFVIGFAALSLGFMGCGNGSADQEQLKTEIDQIESSTTQVDSSMSEVKKTSAELDDILNQLEAQ